MEFTFQELNTIANVLGKLPRAITEETLDTAMAQKALWEIMQITDADKEHINWTPVVIDGRQQIQYENVSIERVLDAEQQATLVAFLGEALSGIKGELIPILVPVMLQMGWEPTRQRVKELLTNQARPLTIEQAGPLLELYNERR